MLERVPHQFRELQEITMQTDTRDILAHATRQSESHEDYFLVEWTPMSPKLHSGQKSLP